MKLFYTKGSWRILNAPLVNESVSIAKRMKLVKNRILLTLAKH